MSEKNYIYRGGIPITLLGTRGFDAITSAQIYFSESILKNISQPTAVCHNSDEVHSDFEGICNLFYSILVYILVYYSYNSFIKRFDKYNIKIMGQSNIIKYDVS